MKQYLVDIRKNRYDTILISCCVDVVVGETAEETLENIMSKLNVMLGNEYDHLIIESVYILN